MRCLELILTLACAGYCIRLASLPKLGTPWLIVLPLVLVALLIAQLLLEGWRWQMLPVYAVVLAAVADSLAPGTRSATTMLYAAVAALAMLALSTLASLVFQHLALTRPGGALPVGFTTLPYSPRQQGRSNGSEQLPAPLKQLWYPGAPLPLGRRVAAFLSERFAHRLKATDTVPATADLPPASGPAKYPMLVYVGGWPEDSVQNRSLICDLVSRGFVVVSLQYPGRPPGMTQQEFTAQLARLARPMADYSSAAAFQQTVELDNERARIFAGDASAVLDEIASLDHGEGIAGIGRIVDLQRAGVFGFSFGGGVAAQASRADPRFKAAVNIDGRHWADGLQHGVEQPYMFLGERLLMPTAEQLASSDPATRYEAGMDVTDYTQLANNLRRNGGIQVTIDGTAHMNFSDDVLRSPLRRYSSGGPIDAQRALHIANSFVVAFFETRLAQRASSWFETDAAAFPEVHTQYWPAPGTPTR